MEVADDLSGGSIPRRPRNLERKHAFFCYACGRILSTSNVRTFSACLNCHTKTYRSWFDGMEQRFNFLHTASSVQPIASEVDHDYGCAHLFSRARRRLEEIESKENDINGIVVLDAEPDGPTIDRECPACGNDRMTYVAMQTRSADEGQTVIYTCTRCGKREVENS